ncbi:MAG: HEPN domain-containing protein [Bacteroidetes bacterium]|nr:MAG: HEPN domain-containing protein [Bacteroidota bacterium]
MPTITQLKGLAELRLKEAEQLYQQGMYDGAYYLGGYTIEFALKARICKLLEVILYPENFQSFKIHKLSELVYLAGLSAEWESKKKTNSTFQDNSDLVFAWNETLRYFPEGTKSQINTQKFLNAITDSTDGIFTWIKTKW